MRTKKTYKHMTQEDFDNVKTLIKLQLSSNQIEKITGKTGSTIGYVKRSETFEEYQEIIRQNNLRRINKQTEPTPVTQTAVVTEDLLQVLTNIQDVLREMRADMKWIADHQVVESNKKFGLF